MKVLPAGHDCWPSRLDGNWHCRLDCEDVDDDRLITVFFEVEGVRCSDGWHWERTHVSGATIRWRGRDRQLNDWLFDQEDVWDEEIEKAMEAEYQREQEVLREREAGIE